MIVRDPQIEAFQLAHVNHCGGRLEPDGIRGPLTEWAEAVATLCEQRRNLLAVAQLHYGLKEHPPRSNDDPKGLIRGWCARCGCKPGDPWCASWASWVLSEVLGKSLCVGGALRLARIFPVTRRPIAGDMFCYPTNGRGNGHVGFVSGSRFDAGELAEVMTIEANCGDQIASWRRAPQGLTFHRPIDDATGTPPGVVPSVLLAAGGTR